ncbi:DUF6281 family protein [Streptomyces sp. NPDC055059]|uniref:DUF6281 family protein n=1 Tax=unclassified Streptomyces TaxID=2593676 RepID=UPI0022548954|nr:DUF6281 family protein [Streptomyces sp. NBC_00120]MCX5322243.1 DUF6281 family protein [Streptomyces sp. NBC_00120]
MNSATIGRRGSVAKIVVLAAAGVMSVACSSSSDGETDASCEYRVEYKEHTYSDVANAHFKIGKKLGEATFPPCSDSSNDGGGQASPDSTVAYEIVGVSPKVAIAVDDAPDDVLFVEVGTDNDLPPEIKKLLKKS